MTTMKPGRPRALLYHRQSLARNDSISIELQDSANRAYCDRMGYEVVEVVVEEGVSGFKDWRKRPRFPAVLSSGADVLVVYRWSRLSRRRLDQAMLIDELERAGLRVESSTEPVDPTTAGGRLSRDMMLSFAAYESEVKAEQIKEAHRRRLDAGLTQTGRARFGYTQPNRAEYIPDPAVAPLLAEAYRRYTAGAGFTQLARWMTDQGAASTKGRAFTGHTLRQVMDSGFAAGLLVQGTEGPGPVTYLPGAHEAAVQRDDWEAYLRARAGRRVEPPSRRAPAWHLTGVAFCGHCGSQLHVTSYTSPYSYVRCTLRARGGACAGARARRADFESEVALWLGGRLDLLAAEAPSRDAERERLARERDSSQAAMDEAQGALGRLAASHARGLVDEAAFLAAQGELTAERDGAAAALERAADELSRLAPPVDPWDVLERAPETTPAEFARMIGRVVRRVELTSEGMTFVPVVGEPESFPRA